MAAPRSFAPRTGHLLGASPSPFPGAGTPWHRERAKESYPLAKFYHGFFLKLGDGKLSRVKTGQSEDPEEARVPGKKGGSRIPRRGPRGRSHSSQPPLRRVHPRHNPEHFPRCEGMVALSSSTRARQRPLGDRGE
jgi:hypothetical protein